MKTVLFPENQLYFHFSLCLLSTGDFRGLRIIWHTQYTPLLAAQDYGKCKDDMPSRLQLPFTSPLYFISL
jgi:hypothetical protein